MIKKLKDILNSYTDEELEDMDLWIDSSVQVDSIWVEEFNINIITREAKVDINGYLDKESKQETYLPNVNKEESEVL